MSKTETLYPLSTVGGRIQYLRRQQGLRREELHELIAEKEISRVYTDNPESKYRTVKGWESGETAPSLEQINAMCDIFGCSADYLLGRMEEKTHDAHFVCEYTGLTERAVNILNKLVTAEDNPDIDIVPLLVSLRTLSVLNCLIENDIMDDFKDQTQKSLLCGLFDYFVYGYEMEYFGEAAQKEFLTKTTGMGGSFSERNMVGLIKRIVLLGEQLDKNGVSKDMFRELRYSETS